MWHVQWHVLQCFVVCCSVLQCVTVFCSVLQCVACVAGVLWRSGCECAIVRCSTLQCVAVCCSVLPRVPACCSVLQLKRCSRHSCYVTHVAVYCSALQYLIVCCSVLQCVAVCCSHSGARDTRVASHLTRVAVCCSVLQYPIVCCSVLQCAAVCCSVLQSQRCSRHFCHKSRMCVCVCVCDEAEHLLDKCHIRDIKESIHTKYHTFDVEQLRSAGVAIPDSTLHPRAHTHTHTRFCVIFWYTQQTYASSLLAKIGGGSLIRNRQLQSAYIRG